MSASKTESVLIYDISYGGNKSIFSIRTDIVDGSVMSVPSIGAADLPDPSRILVSNRLDHVGTLQSVPVSMGGTGLSSLPASGTILMSNGTKYVPLPAGTGITIDASTQTISSTQYTTGGTYAVDANGIGNFVLSHKASSRGEQIVGTIDLKGYKVVNLSIHGAMYRPGENVGGGVCTQLYRILNGECRPYGNNETSITGPSMLNVKVSPSVSGSTLTLNVNLEVGDQWKGFIQIVSI